MLYFIFIPITFALFAAFVLLTLVEGKSNARVLGTTRDRFDARVQRAGFVLRHVDWGAFVNDVARTGIERALHDVAHGTLIAVRFLERVLTRAVRSLRMRRQQALQGLDMAIAKESRITSTVTYLKTTLRKTRRTPPPAPLPGEDAGDVVEL